MKNKLIMYLMITSVAYSQENADMTGVTISFGGGSVNTVIPAFIGNFAVNDESGSNSTYFFSADIEGSESYSPLLLTMSGDLAHRLGMDLGKMDVPLSFSIGYAPLGGGAGIFSGLIGAGIGYRVHDFVKLGAGAGFGFLGYNISFDVERESLGDIFMTFDETNIYFDNDGLARATLQKDGAVLAPEFNLQLGKEDGKLGLQVKYQMLSHSSDPTDPWKIRFTETIDDKEDKASVTIDYTGSYVYDGGTEFPELDLSGGLLSVELILRMGNF